MSHDFARSQRLKKESSARKGKKKPAPKKSGGVPSWLWLLAGTLVGFLIMLLVYLSGFAPPLPNPRSAEQKSTTSKSETKQAGEPAAPAKRVSPVFEFYTKLPEGGQPITNIQPGEQPDPAAPLPAANKDANVAQPAKETQQQAPQQPLDPIQQLLAEQEAAKLAATKAAAVAKPDAPKTDAQKADVAKTEKAKTETAKPEMTSKPEVAKAPSTKPDAAKTDAAKAEQAKKELAKAELAKTEQAKAEQAKKEAAKTAAAPTAALKGRYLQAGAFRSKSEIDRQRAKISLLGLRPSVLTVTNEKGESLQKVVVGPFNSDREMESARILLNGNGVSSIPAK